MLAAARQEKERRCVMWKPTGMIRYRKANWFGRKKLVLQLQERRFGMQDDENFGIMEGYEVRWRDATPEDLPVAGFCD